MYQLNIGDSGKALVEKFNINTSFIENNINSLNNKFNIIDGLGLFQIVTYNVANEAQNLSNNIYNYAIDIGNSINMNPVFWYFYKSTPSGDYELLNIDSAYSLLGGAGNYILFCNDDLTNENLFLKVIGYGGTFKNE